MPRIFLKVFVPGPFSGALTYQAESPIDRGIRVRVPLGHREVIGLTGETLPACDVTEETKPVLEVLDQAPLLSADIFR